MTRWLALPVALLAWLALLLGINAQGAVADAPGFHDADGISVVSATPAGDRVWKLVVSTAALSRPVRVDLLLPAGYADTTTNYPVLYLFHGTSGGADDWLNDGNAAAATASYPMIVVMPDAGYNGDGGSWFTNWVDQSTALGTSNWETFHIDQLVPWVDANLRTIATRDGRAIAGLSQGGFGSFSYAARHPDLFVSAASFSGAPDLTTNPIVTTGATGIIDATAVGLDNVEPDAMFGDPVTDRINWEGHDPAQLVTNLAHTSLGLWSGNGVPGPLDQPGAQTVPDALIEGATHTSSVYFTHAANSAHVAYTYDYYGNGTHSWPYWSRDLVQYLPTLMATFAAAPPTPTAISYKSVDKTWTQWGWTVAVNRTAAQAWSGLVNAATTGFALSSNKPATVTTPASFVPGATYQLAAKGGRVPTSVVADGSGRLTVLVTPAAGKSSVAVTIAAA